MFYVFLFIIGLAAGSFLNVVTLRYKEDEKFSLKTIGGRSHCPRCGKILKWYELIPVLSFFIQRGRCRNCKAKLSIQYPLVEIITALGFVFIPGYFASNGFSIFGAAFYGEFWPIVVASIIWLAAFLIFISISIIDFRLMIIPDGANIALGFLGILSIIFQAYVLKLNSPTSFLGYYSRFFPVIDNFWLNHLAAVLAGIIFFGAIIFFSRGRAMGFGDLKLIAALGVIFSWPDIIIVIALSFIVGSLYSAFLMLKKRKGMKDFVPFGPFIIIASLLVFFFGLQLIELYFKLFGIIY